jgi:hypothetical protein
MTELNRVVKRRARAPFAHYRRRIVVILEPGDVLGMRLEGSRVTYKAPLSEVFRVIASWHAAATKKKRSSV